MKQNGFFKIQNAVTNIFDTKNNFTFPMERHVSEILTKNSFGKIPLKILALHGGGQSVSSFRSMQGMQDLMSQLPEFEFVFADSPEDGNVWIRDPPGGKQFPTTDPSWADDTIAFLDKIVEEQGPFYGILGFSQGAAMIPVYLSKTTNTFDRIMLYCGYLPTTHQGLIETIEKVQPFPIPTMVFSGENDIGFRDLAPALSAIFSSSVEQKSSTAGHHLPFQNDATFEAIVMFIEK